jgi:molybdopterin synthase catalytic subunit
MLTYVNNDKSIGATALFLGLVRDHTEKAKKVYGIFYEAYIEMAKELLSEIEKETFELWNIKKFVAMHRIGYLKVNEVSVGVAVSSQHRKESLEACTYAIENIKSRVPIWKKEMSESGGSWINAVNDELGS